MGKQGETIYFIKGQGERLLQGRAHSGAPATTQTRLLHLAVYEGYLATRPVRDIRWDEGASEKITLNITRFVSLKTISNLQNEYKIFSLSKLKNICD